jgi:hypothetical protein
MPRRRWYAGRRGLASGTAVLVLTGVNGNRTSSVGGESARSSSR